MDQVKIDQAACFARGYHASQMYGDQPYMVHLYAVMDRLEFFGITDTDILIAGLLHDTVEDTNCRIQDIGILFGERVAEIVRRVTNEPGKNRKERARKTYPKTREMKEAILVKLADRICNSESAKKDNSDLFKMYFKEYPSFRDALYMPSVADKMWAHLDLVMGYLPPPPDLL